jgi:hypothetical protein
MDEGGEVYIKDFDATDDAKVFFWSGSRSNMKRIACCRGERPGLIDGNRGDVGTEGLATWVGARSGVVFAIIALHQAVQPIMLPG